MRINQIVEMPVAAYDTIGDFEKRGSFSRSKVDTRLATSDTSIGKAKKFFDGTDFEFRLYPVNKPGLGNYSEHGEISPEQLIKALPEAEAIVNDPNGKDTITIFYVNNSGADKIPFTPWMMGHRMGHAVRKGNYQWEEYEKLWDRVLNQIVVDGYNITIDGQNLMGLNPQVASAISNALGTMRSARKGLIKRPYEFLYEMFAQYLNTGGLKFNPLPQQISYGKKAWGNSINGLYNRDPLMLDEINDSLEHSIIPQLEYAIESVLGTCYGKYYFM